MTIQKIFVILLFTPARTFIYTDAEVYYAGINGCNPAKGGVICIVTKKVDNLYHLLYNNLKNEIITQQDRSDHHTFIYTILFPGKIYKSTVGCIMKQLNNYTLYSVGGGFDGMYEVKEWG